MELPRGVTGFGAGVRAGIQGFSILLSDAQQGRRALIPVGLTLVLYVFAFAGTLWTAGPLLEVVWSAPEEGRGWALLGWQAVRLLVGLGIFVALCLLFTALLEIVAGPFFDAIAHQELKAAGLEVQNTGLWDGTVLEALRAILMVLPLLLFAGLALFPALTPVATLAGGIWAALGFGAGALNPSLVACGLTMHQRLGLLACRASVFLGLGAVVLSSLLVPVVGWLALPGAVAGGARLVARAASHPSANDSSEKPSVRS